MSFDCNYEELKKLAVEFLKQIPDCNDIDNLNNGWKCFGLHYLGLQTDNKAELAMAPGLFQFVSRKYMEREFQLDLESDK